MLDTAVDRIKRINRLFLMTVVLPTLGAIIYFGLFASDVYISESRFVVRSPDKPATSGLGVLLKSAGFSNASDELSAAQEFLQSRDALRAVNKNGFLAKSYSDNSISIFNRFENGTFEDLYKYYLKKITVNRESSSSIITLTVKAYRPADARYINEKLLQLAEGTVNQLNERARKDLIRFAQSEVENAKNSSRIAALSLAAYRNREGIVEPEKQAAIQLEMIAKLQDELIANKTELAQIKTFTPQNPQVEVLEARVRGLSQQIDEQTGRVAGDRKSLAATAAQYQRLFLESQFSDKQLAIAMASLESALNEARRQQAYVERIVQPNLPDDALEPRRIRGIFATFVLGLVIWGILSMLHIGIREHKA
jgi:capsular polysaccharide transport system permease protein